MKTWCYRLAETCWCDGEWSEGLECPLWDKGKKQCGDVTNRESLKGMAESLKSISESLKDLHVGIAK